MARLIFLYPIRWCRAAAISFSPAARRIVAVAMALLIACVMTASPVRAEDRVVRMAVPETLVETGFLKYLLPRFSLKTQVRVQLVAPGAVAEAALTADGGAGRRPVFQGSTDLWHLEVLDEAHPGTSRFVDWLGSDIGARTITAYAPDGVQMFTLPEVQVAEAEEILFEGDAELGESLSRTMCGRCHAVADDMHLNDIGSTPSFFVLRTLPDWDYRFQAFYALNPHPSFTQVADVTPPFPDDRPSPIVPVTMTLDDLEAILAYVAILEPADLGAPLQHQ
jgi:cytochrome c553